MLHSVSWWGAEVASQRRGRKLALRQLEGSEIERWNLLHEVVSLCGRRAWFSHRVMSGELARPCGACMFTCFLVRRAVILGCQVFWPTVVCLSVVKETAWSLRLPSWTDASVGRSKHQDMCLDTWPRCLWRKANQNKEVNDDHFKMHSSLLPQDGLTTSPLQIPPKIHFGLQLLHLVLRHRLKELILQYDADSRHVEVLLFQTDFEDASGCTVLRSRSTWETPHHEFAPQEAPRFRSVSGRFKHLSADRPDFAFSVKDHAKRVVRAKQTTQWGGQESFSRPCKASAHGVEVWLPKPSQKRFDVTLTATRRMRIHTPQHEQRVDSPSGDRCSSMISLS